MSLSGLDLCHPAMSGGVESGVFPPTNWNLPVLAIHFRKRLIHVRKDFADSAATHFQSLGIELGPAFPGGDERIRLSFGKRGPRHHAAFQTLRRTLLLGIEFQDCAIDSLADVRPHCRPFVERYRAVDDLAAEPVGVNLAVFIGLDVEAKLAVLAEPFAPAFIRGAHEPPQIAHRDFRFRALGRRTVCLLGFLGLFHAERPAQVGPDFLAFLDRERPRRLAAFNDLKIVYCLNDEVARGVHVSVRGAAFRGLENAAPQGAKIPRRPALAE
ncbi:MAG TPA: hypothetical protein VNH11_06295 [Pirellulales bacterium]|nr:hypothetical protein [Pirellulales bacterium]